MRYDVLLLTSNDGHDVFFSSILAVAHVLPRLMFTLMLRLQVLGLLPLLLRVMIDSLEDKTVID